MGLCVSCFRKPKKSGKDKQEGHFGQHLCSPNNGNSFIISSDEDKLQHQSPLERTSPEGPCSAVVRSIVPQIIILRTVDINGHSKGLGVDEFGFCVEEDSENSNKLTYPFLEDVQQRLIWNSYLELRDSSSFPNVHPQLLPPKKPLKMVLGGIPHSMRPVIWMRLSGALLKKLNSTICYREILRSSSNVTNDHLAGYRQIENDLPQILTTNVCFSLPQETGIARLRRVLRGISWLYPDLGYCQGVGVMAAVLLLLLEEEDAFWLLSTIVDDLLPYSYYTPSQIGVKVDQFVLRQLIADFMPSVDSLLRNHEIDLYIISLPWFLTLFSSELHIGVLVRFWDVFFCERYGCLFRFALAMIGSQEDQLKELKNSVEISQALSNLPSQIQDVEELLDAAYSFPGASIDVMVDNLRRRHLANVLCGFDF